MHLVTGCAVLLLIVVVVIAVAVALIAYMKRDAARHPRGSGTLGTALQEVEGLFVESKKHVIEAEQDQHREEDESGEPPEK